MKHRKLIDLLACNKDYFIKRRDCYWVSSNKVKMKHLASILALIGLTAFVSVQSVGIQSVILDTAGNIGSGMSGGVSRITITIRNTVNFACQIPDISNIADNQNYTISGSLLSSCAPPYDLPDGTVSNFQVCKFTVSFVNILANYCA